MKKLLLFLSLLFGLLTGRAAPTLVCPTTTITNPNYTLVWTHNNPTSTTVNYDPRVNGIDPGNSVTYPATTFPLDLGAFIGTTGTGTVTINCFTGITETRLIFSRLVHVLLTTIFAILVLEQWIALQVK